MVSLRKTARAITVPEILIVLCTLAILLALLFPGTGGSGFESSHRAQAKNDATQIDIAIQNYLSEYGELPASKAGNINSAELMNLLAGEMQGKRNPREIVFLEVPRAKGGRNGAESDGETQRFLSGYKDSWGNLYEVRIDADDDGTVAWPGGEVKRSAIVWTKGDPKKRKAFEDRSRWIKSWE